MNGVVRPVATALAGVLAIGGVIALVAQRVILSGTLFLFTAFAIYVRETYPEE